MLAVESLAFGYPQRTVGRDVSFTLDAGEVMCVLGPNGSGKTTLLRTLLGLLPPHAGQILFHQKSLFSLSRAEIARTAGYVPQAHQPYFAYSVRDMVLMGRSAHLGTFSMPGAHDREVAARVLESLGIAPLAERPVTEISAGERQLALVARALAQEPRLLVMDEPTASLDFGNQVRVLERIAALAAGGISILFSTHDPDHAFVAAQRALLLAEGRVLALGTPREVIRADTLERLYHVAVQVVPLEGGGHTCLPCVK
ncbi:MAG: ABC transporter ATP-binding protein [Betaproteobacteria bacterium]|nr:MAG: ABC transporter ATP-binding protein [Betaproteobacteria bacterium]